VTNLSDRSLWQGWSHSSMPLFFRRRKERLCGLSVCRRDNSKSNERILTLEVIFNVLRSINPRFTYLLTMDGWRAVKDQRVQFQLRSSWGSASRVPQSTSYTHSCCTDSELFARWQHHLSEGLCRPSTDVLVTSCQSSTCNVLLIKITRRLRAPSNQ